MQYYNYTHGTYCQLVQKWIAEEEEKEQVDIKIQ